MKIHITCIIALVILVGSVVLADSEEDMQKAALRAKMALMRVHTAVSSDRGLAVSGPRPEGNALLLQAVQRIREDLESLVGIPLPLGSQRLRLQVFRSDTELPEDATISSRVEKQGDVFSHRVELPNYLSAYEPEAREQVLYAMLRIYSIGATDPAARDSLPVVPVWLGQGVLQVLDSNSRNLTLAYMDELWRKGQVPPLGTFFRKLSGNNLSVKERMVAGTLVYWLASRLYADDFFSGLFADVGVGKAVSFDWLREELGEDPDELFDRWLLAQDHTVRAVGSIMIPHIESLRELLYVYPGQHGIPRPEEIPSGAPLSMLAAYREADWFGRVVLTRRQLIQLAGQGRHSRMQAVIDAFLDILDGVEDGSALKLLQKQEKQAHSLLDVLAEDILAAGGILREEE